MNLRVLYAMLLWGYVLVATDDATKSPPSRATKDWNFIVYVAGDNNLGGFAPRNLKQIASVGSNEHVNFLAHVDIRLPGNRKTTRRYYIDKNQIYQVNVNDDTRPPMDSGDPQTLISACKWAIEEFPAKHHALILWNHGTGIIDPMGGRLLDMQRLFFYNPETNTYDLDRTFGFLDLLEKLNYDPKGICWDDTTGNYLTNQKLEMALQEICTNQLGGKKFDIIGFDACLMSMIEIAEFIKKFAEIQVSSQEVEPGPGWDYGIALSLFNQGSPTAELLARNIVQAYATSYQKITRDYTLSALRLSEMERLEENVRNISDALLQLLQSHSHVVIKQAIRISKSNTQCTHFDEPSYKDLHHFYSNLQDQLSHHFKKITKNDHALVHHVIALLEEGKQLIQQAVVANVAGPNLARAQGISIYFPERKMHPSYRKTNFAKNNSWIELVTKLLIS